MVPSLLLWLGIPARGPLGCPVLEYLVLERPVLERPVSEGPMLERPMLGCPVPVLMPMSALVPEPGPAVVRPAARR
jgi:hypothetical protein